MLVGPQVGLDADRADRQNLGLDAELAGRRLDFRDHALEIGGVGGARSAEKPDTQSGPGEGVVPDHVPVQAEPLAELPHFDFVKLGQRLDDAALLDHLLDQRHAVVVRLDGVRALGAAGLDGVRVDRALAQQMAVDAQPPWPPARRPR